MRTEQEDNQGIGVTNMSKKINRKAVIAIVAVIAVIAVIGSTLAWFVTGTSKSQNFSLTGINVSARVYFQNGKAQVEADKYKDENGLYDLSLKKSDENYIGNLRVTVKRSGSICTLRVKTAFEWRLADGSVSQNTTDVPFVFYDGWYDNRSVDYCVYYQGSDLSGKARADTLYMIKGFDESSFDASALEDGASVKALIEVDAVQFNRYPQLWNIEKLPWE